MSQDQKPGWAVVSSYWLLLEATWRRLGKMLGAEEPLRLHPKDTEMKGLRDYLSKGHSWMW